MCNICVNLKTVHLPKCCTCRLSNSNTFDTITNLIAAFRFGMLQSKLGLATLICNFKFTLSEKMSVRMQVGNIVTAVEGHVWLNVSRVR